MKKGMLRYIILLLLPVSVFGQQLQFSPAIVSTQGYTSSNANIVLSWTLGENNVQTLATKHGFITEGFHQPIIKINSDQTPIVESEIFDIVLSPNPVHATLQVQMSKPHKTQYLILSNPLGNILQQITASPNDSIIQIEMGYLPSGIYLLHISDKDAKVLGTYQILKI